MNGDPHIGHAVDYCLADVCARYHRLLGSEVKFEAGSDEHGSKISQKADIKKMFWGCNISLKNLPKCLINRMESFDFYEWDADADY